MRWVQDLIHGLELNGLNHYIGREIYCVIYLFHGQRNTNVNAVQCAFSSLGEQGLEYG